MKLYNKFIPTNFVTNIKDIDYEKLIEQGIKALFFDLDNTIISYDETVIPNEMANYLEELNKKFKVLVISNSRKNRVETASASLSTIPYIKFAKKPFKFGFKKALKKVNLKNNEVAVIGDQLMTDVFGANRMKFKVSILVYPIKKRSDVFTTRMNRKMEKRVLKKIKKKNPIKYNEVLKQYEELG